MNVLVLNAGSSSLKFQMIDAAREKRLCRGLLDGFPGRAAFTLEADGQKTKGNIDLRGMHEAVEYIASSITDRVEAIGHRVVHGGPLFSESVLIDDDVVDAIRECCSLAPLHNANNLSGIESARNIFGTALPEVAVFDTAFHQTLPDYAFHYAIPRELYERHGIRRYGFHGTSHRYIAGRYAALRGRDANIVTLHLGNGCSACAIRGGESVDTSMGMTPLEGLMMGSRSGDIDPSVVGLIADREGLTGEDVEKLLNRRSGLLGVSGRTNDMRELLDAERKGDARATLAVQMFCYRVRKYIGAYLAAMGGAEAIVFTGGIGENSPEIRRRICDGLSWAGLNMDASANDSMAGKEGCISRAGATLQAWVIPTDEELMVAHDTCAIVSAASTRAETCA